MNGRRWFFLGLLSLMFIFVLTGWGNQVQSQPKYPTKSIDVIVAFSAGGSHDLTSRIMANYFKKKWGIPVNVINKPGGNSVPATLEVYNAAPDGYTLLADGFGVSSTVAVAVKNLPYEVMDRTYIAMIYCSPTVIFVPPSTPFKTMKDLADEAKRNPENFTWASLGGVGGGDYYMRVFFKIIGVDISKTKPIIARGASQSVNLTAGGSILMGSSTVLTALNAIRAGLVRPLAIGSKGGRWPDLPDLPTLEEEGYESGYIYWGGISGPPQLPSYIADTLGKTIEEMLKDPEVTSQMKNIGCLPYYHNSREMREYVSKEIEKVKEAWGLK